MVAYSLQKRFSEPIVEGRKRQMIRGNRKRHARPGEELQLYVGMGTRHCRLIMRTMCISIAPIVLCPARNFVYVGEAHWGHNSFGDEAFDAKDIGLDRFGMSGRFVNPYRPALARADGFNGWPEMRRYWFDRAAQDKEGVFVGVILRWGDRA